MISDLFSTFYTVNTATELVLNTLINLCDTYGGIVLSKFLLVFLANRKCHLSLSMGLFSIKYYLDGMESVGVSEI